MVGYCMVHDGLQAGVHGGLLRMVHDGQLRQLPCA